MKRVSLLTVAAFALLVPALVNAQAPFVYRPELRQWVPVPPEPAKTVIVHSLGEEIARHEHMALAYRGTRMAQAAVHCDRLIARLREARKEK